MGPDRDHGARPAARFRRGEHRLAATRGTGRSTRGFARRSRYRRGRSGDWAGRIGARIWSVTAGGRSGGEPHVAQEHREPGLRSLAPRSVPGPRNGVTANRRERPACLAGRARPGSAIPPVLGRAPCTGCNVPLASWPRGSESPRVEGTPTPWEYKHHALKPTRPRTPEWAFTRTSSQPATRPKLRASARRGIGVLDPWAHSPDPTARAKFSARCKLLQIAHRTASFSTSRASKNPTILGDDGSDSGG